MLKILDTTKTFSHFENRKCAEVFYQSEHFSIICVECEMKTFEFNDFLLHFKNVHVQNVDSIKIKCETEIVQDKNFTYVDQFQKHHEMSLSPNVKYSDDNDSNADNIPLKKVINWKVEEEEWNNTTAVSETEDEMYEGNADINSDDDEEYAPKILKNKRKKCMDNFSNTKCLQCNKSYKFAKNLERHIKTAHNPEAIYNCPSCEQSFPQERTLNLHLKKEHSGFPCAQCDRVYKSKESLNTHQFVHSGERRFLCDVEDCKKSFFNRKHLSAHKRLVHVAERNFVCEVCGYRSKIQSALIVHKRSHTGEKPYICNICGKGFASRSLLIEHKPIHSTDRPHVCGECGAAFSRPKALYHHKHLHLPVKKFVCKLCDRAYAQAAGLAGHMRQHRAEQFSCT